MNGIYEDLMRLWHEFLTFGPPIDKVAFHPMDFVNWLSIEHDATYELRDVKVFLAKKERREGTTLKGEQQLCHINP